MFLAFGDFTDAQLFVIMCLFELYLSTDVASWIVVDEYVHHNTNNGRNPAEDTHDQKKAGQS